jgi:hypothetical protein
MSRRFTELIQNNTDKIQVYQTFIHQFLSKYNPVLVSKVLDVSKVTRNELLRGLVGLNIARKGVIRV